MDQRRPPEDGSPPPPPGGGDADGGGTSSTEDGPPPPPPLAGRMPAPTPPAASAGEPTRATNRRWPLVLALVVVLVGVPAGLYTLSLLDDGDTDTAAAPEDEGAPDEGDRGVEDDADGEPDDGTDDGTDDGPEGGEDPDTDPDDPDTDPDDPGTGPDDVLPVEPPDLGSLEGTDLLWGRVLTDIDASEREMIAFQDDLAAAFQRPPGDLDAPLDAAAEVAATRLAALLEIRARLADEVDDAAVDEVREAYVLHLDSWAAFMAAVEEDPLVVLEQSERGFTVDINATADAFARALEEELPGDVDAEVERFADGILDRGFRGFGTAQV